MDFLFFSFPFDFFFHAVWPSSITRPDRSASSGVAPSVWVVVGWGESLLTGNIGENEPPILWMKKKKTEDAQVLCLVKQKKEKRIKKEKEKKTKKMRESFSLLSPFNLNPYFLSLNFFLSRLILSLDGFLSFEVIFLRFL